MTHGRVKPQVNMSANSDKRLIAIKLLHTAIWAFMAFCVFYIVWAGIRGFINYFVWTAIFTILSEGLILLIFKWSCPLTVVAGRYTDDRMVNFDIFLPEFIARHNKLIFTVLYIIGII